MQTTSLKIGFIGLGNVGAKLAASLLRNKLDLTVLDLNRALVDDFVSRGASSALNPADLTSKVDVIITCLPSPAVCAEVMEAEQGILSVLREGQIWLEMSTTDEAEVKRLGTKVAAVGAMAVDCPVSGGCHRAATGNIAIFAGCERRTFEAVLPILTSMGRRILHTGELGSASLLKVLTNYLATIHLVALSEAFVVASKADMDMNTTFEAIRISSGNSFVHETESQVILNGSRDINFTMDLVCKDIGLFDKIAQRHKVPLELSPLLCSIFEDAKKQYGDRELSPNIIRRYEEPVGVKILGEGFPAEITDSEPEQPGYEVKAYKS